MTFGCEPRNLTKHKPRWKMEFAHSKECISNPDEDGTSWEYPNSTEVGGGAKSAPEALCTVGRPGASEEQEVEQAGLVQTRTQETQPQTPPGARKEGNRRLLPVLDDCVLCDFRRRMERRVDATGRECVSPSTQAFDDSRTPSFTHRTSSASRTMRSESRCSHGQAGGTVGDRQEGRDERISRTMVQVDRTRDDGRVPRP